MRKRVAFFTLTFAIVSVGTAAYVHADHDHDRGRLHARLRGLNEVPPTTSPGSAELSATISSDQTSIAFTLTFKDLTGNPGAAHIHFGPSKVNGGVMVFFCGGGGKPACPAAIAGTVTGIITAADIVGPAAQGIPPAPAGRFEDVLRAINTGNAYANIHSAQFPAGEIRGQVNGDDDR
jgi:hypothetical protein